MSSVSRLPGVGAIRLPTGQDAIEHMNKEPLIWPLNRAGVRTSGGTPGRTPGGCSERPANTTPPPRRPGYGQRLEWRGTREPFTAASHGKARWDVSVRGVRDGRRIPSWEHLPGP
ncbi:hypothetical protein ACE1SV_15660 [Streptomyces sp. E-15]